MNSPMPELLDAYGTDGYYLKKMGALPVDARVGAGLAFMTHYALDREKREQQLDNAERMNRKFRALEHNRMKDAIAGFGGTVGPAQIVQGVGRTLPEDVIKTSSVDLSPEACEFAADLGRKLARSTMDKEAGMGFAGGVGNFLKNMWSKGGARMATKKPLISGWTKAKVGLTGLGALGALGVYKAGKTARDYMMMPTSQERWGAFGPSVRSQVTPWGY